MLTTAARYPSPPLKLQLPGLDHGLAVERDGRAGERDEVAVGGLVVAAGPGVVADADGDGAGGHPGGGLAVGGELDVRVDAEVHDGEEVFALARGVVRLLHLREARPRAGDGGELAGRERQRQVVDLLPLVIVE